MEASATKDLLRDIYEWWKNASHPCPASFCPNFTYEDGHDSFPEDDWLWWVRQNTGWGDPELIAIVGEADGGAMLFSGTDPVTLLRHRVCWIVEVDGQAVRRILATSAVVGGGGA
jgi:hypothetical protein